MQARRETRSLDIRRQSFDRLDRRRSAELCRSTRRYDEYWGAAEKSDTRLKCGDGTIHHVHSQMCILWSPVLRDMINLYPTPNLLESTHGLAYLLHVEEDAATWAAVLDMIYPVTLQQQAATDWELLERCLLLCDKYDMAVLQQRLAGRLTEPCCTYSTDPSQPNFALRWLRLAERLQLPEVSARILAYLREGLAQLGSQPDASAAVLAYAQEHLSKEQLLQLLQISMQAASSYQQQQQQSAQQAGFMQPQAQQMLMQPQQQMTLSAAFNGWLGQGQGPSSSGSQGFSQQQQAMQQQLRLGWQQPVPLFNQGTQQQQQQQQHHAGAFTTCSGTSSDPTVGESALCSDEGSSDNGDAAADSQQQQQQGVNVEQHRLKLCMSSGLFAPAALPQQQQQQQQQQWRTCSTPAPTPAASFAAPVPARSASAACPVPRFPVGQAAGFVSLAPRAQLVPQQAFGMQAESFGFGVNGGSASIADWMRSQPEGMCLS